MTKVKLDTIKPWIANRITELLGGMEDDVVVEYVFNQLDADKVIMNIPISFNFHSLILCILYYKVISFSLLFKNEMALPA
jgi:hypothetical protein